MFHVFDITLMLKRIAKRFLPESAKEIILQARRLATGVISRWVVPLAASSRATSQLYYTIFSQAFAREQHAVLYGRYKYTESLQYQEEADEFTLLRRNTHRLEKGLLMRPRKEVFALGYIEETVEAYARRARVMGNENMIADLGELSWVQDVLNAYFIAVEEHPVVNRSKHIFYAAKENAEISGVEADRGPNGRRVPYHRDSNHAPVSYEAFRKLANKRRSVRWFSKRTVSRESIDKAISIALQAPSACNRQPFEFRVYDDRELVKEIANLPGGTKGYAHNIPVIIVITGRLRAYFSERDRHVIYIDASLAAMSFMLALETMGLSSCPINWPDVERREKAMQEMLNLEPDERPVMLLAIGYPDTEGMVAYSEKKHVSRIRSYNKR